MAKLSISIPDELKELLDGKARADQVPVSSVVSEALRSYFSLPSPAPAVPPELTERVQALEAYLWKLHFSHECTRSAALNLYYWAGRNGETLGMPPEQEMAKPTWPSSAEPKPAQDTGKKFKAAGKKSVGKPVKSRS